MSRTDKRVVPKLKGRKVKRKATRYDFLIRMERLRGPQFMTAEEMSESLRRAGLAFGAKNEDAAVRTRLYKDRAIKKVGKNQFRANREEMKTALPKAKRLHKAKLATV